MIHDPSSAAKMLSLLWYMSNDPGVHVYSVTLLWLNVIYLIHHNAYSYSQFCYSQYVLLCVIMADIYSVDYRNIFLCMLVFFSVDPIMYLFSCIHAHCQYLYPFLISYIVLHVYYQWFLSFFFSIYVLSLTCCLGIDELTWFVLNRRDT